MCVCLFWYVLFAVSIGGYIWVCLCVGIYRRFIVVRVIVIECLLCIWFCILYKTVLVFVLLSDVVVIEIEGV